MADLTNLFKATIKSIKSRNKTLNKDVNADIKTNIIPTKKIQGDFETKSKELVKTISKLRDFLLEHRKDYVNAGSHLSGDNSRMTDVDREQIDKEAQNIIQRCRDNLNTVKKTAESQKVHPQIKEHRECVLTLIHTYLKAVCKIYSEQRAVRVKRVVDRKRISRIQPERQLSRRLSKSDVAETDKDMSANAQIADDSTRTDISPKPSPSRVPSIEAPPSYGDFDDEITAEEAQMFEQENKAMFEEMHSLSEEISKIQGKVVEIASLQEVFTDKVLEQEEDIMRIADTAVHTTENIKDANEEIREAMKKNAGFRVWILFFLLVLTFSLLFLDWYSG